MVDSIAVLPPGWRATTNNNALITDGIINFFEAGTTTPLEVFSDKELSVSLGTSVSCNSAGSPVSSGNSKVLIYVGPDAYKIRLTSAIFGGTVFEFDAVRGALDTSSFLTSAAIADKQIINTSTNRAITASDKGKLINANCTAGALTITFDDASDLGDGFWVGVRHDGTANQVIVTGNGTDTFGVGPAVVTSLVIPGRGNTLYFVGDGTKFLADTAFGNITPVGAIVQWATVTPPLGWLECDGAAVSRATYAALFAVIGDDYGMGDGSTTFNLPDLRGEFVRGWDHGRAIDPDRTSRTDRGDGTTGDAVGTKQADGFRLHGHPVRIDARNDDEINATGGFTLSNKSQFNAAAFTGTPDDTAGHQIGGSGGSETRPRNVNLMFIIRFWPL